MYLMGYTYTYVNNYYGNLENDKNLVKLDKDGKSFYVCMF